MAGNVHRDKKGHETFASRRLSNIKKIKYGGSELLSQIPKQE
jgi:hypothetical protein